MKKLYYLICIACALTICLSTTKAAVRGIVNIRFWDNGVLVHTATEEQGAPQQSPEDYYAGTPTSCTGYTFVGWRRGTPLLDEEIFGNDADAGVLSLLAVGSEDIDLYAVYEKDVICYTKITDVNDLVADSTYLIVGFDGTNYHAMRGRAADMVKKADNFGMSGLKSTQVSLCDNDKIYAKSQDYVWKLLGTKDNWRWQNQGATTNYFQLYAHSYLDWFNIYPDYLEQMLTTETNRTTSITFASDGNGGVTIQFTQNIGIRYGNAVNTLYFAPNVTSNDYFGAAQTNLFFVGIRDENNENLKGASISKGTIYLYKSATERRYKSKCDKYKVLLQACGDNSCGTGISVDSTSITEPDPTTSACKGLTQYGTVNPNSVIPSITCDSRWTFKGWAEKPQEKTTTDPASTYVGNSYELKYQDANLYAVYRHKTYSEDAHGYVEDYWSSYPNCSEYTVTFYPCNGQVNGSGNPYPITETPAGTGITLPTASFSACSGWTFAGWATSACESADAAPVGLKNAEATYYPAADGEEFYAVYTNSTRWTSYPVCDKASVTLNAGTGTVDGNTTKVLTETNIGDGVSLIAANSGCPTAWYFAGWSHDIVTTTHTEPTSLISAGTTYHPIKVNDELWAVYYHGIAPHTVWTTSPSCSAYDVILHACGDNTCVYSSVNGKSIETLNEGTIGSGITFPAATTTCSDRWEFAGWNEGSPIAHKYTLPDDLYAASSTYVPAQNEEVFYAVYKHKSADYWTSNPDCALYTVHLHACEGTMPGGKTDEDVEEDVAGQGIALPAVTPLCTARGWSFIGWVEGGDLATTRNIDDVHIITENTYVPLRDNINLYAVYSVSGYKRVTSYEELNTTDSYVIAFYWSYGNAYSYENFALSNTYTNKGTNYSPKYYINLTPIEGYTDADGNHYVADPASNNACKWNLVSDGDNGWYFRNVANNTLYVGSNDNSLGLWVDRDSYKAAYTINLEGHSIERKSYTANYRYWHFINEGVGSVENPKFYAYQDRGPDQCYLYHQTKTLYSSWPHCEEYRVYFDGCDGISEAFWIDEDDAGMGVIVPNVTDICEGWTFAGWAKSAYEEKTGTLTQNLYPAGSTFVPTKNKATLYAVYYQTKDTFELTSGISDMYSGVNYLIVYNNSRALGNTLYNATQGAITGVSIGAPTDSQYKTTNTAIQWRLLGDEGNYVWYNPAANKYLDFTFVYNSYYHAYLRDIISDYFDISYVSNYFVIRSNSNRGELLCRDNDYFDVYTYDGTTDTKIKLYRQKADYWSYPCSKPAEAVKWGDGTVTIESLSLSGTPTKESAVIIEPITAGDDNTYVIKHTARPGRRMRFGWGANNYYYLKVPYIATPTYKPAVENLPNNDLVLLPNSTFAVELNTWLHTVSVYDDATLVIADGNTLTVDTLFLRSEGPNKMPNVIFGGPDAKIVINSGVIYFDYRIDWYRFYPFGLPYNANADEVTYAGLVSNTTVPELYEDYFVQYYDGPARAAASGGSMADTYWTNLKNPSSVLNGGEGYGIGIANNTIGNHNKRTLRFKMTPDDGWNEFETGNDRAITITPSKTENKQNSGWNFVTNPYLHSYYAGNADASKGLLTGHFEWVDGKWIIAQDGTQTVPYLTFYDVESDDYYQTTASTSSIAPFSTAFVQVEDYNQLLFANPIQAENSAPVRKTTKESRIVRTGLILHEKVTDDKEPLYDETGLVISNRYTNEYEVGADLAKEYNKKYLHVYTYNDTYKLAFNALDEQAAAQPIPLGVSVPKTGSYKFIFDFRQYDVDALEALYLTDKQQNKIVDLLDEDYSCTIEKGVNEERFVINVILKPEKEDPTNMEATMVNGLRVLTNTDGSITLYNSSNMTKVQVYDVAGRLLGEWKPNTYQWTVNLPQGVYAVSVQDAQNQITHVKICSK